METNSLWAGGCIWVTPGFMGSRGPCFLPSPPPLYLGPLLSGSHQPPLLHTPAVFPRRHRNRPASRTPPTSPWLGLLHSYTTFRAPAPMPRASSHFPAQGQSQITEHARHCCLRPRSPQEAPFDPCSLFSRRWRLFRPLALGTRSEFRTAWLMKCCFRREAESLFTWGLARAGRQPGRGLWVGFGWGGSPQGQDRPGPPGRTLPSPLSHSHPGLVSLCSGKLTPIARGALDPKNVTVSHTQEADTTEDR